MIKIFLYNDSNASNLDLEEIKRFIEINFGFKEIKIRGKFTSFEILNLNIDAIAKELASFRVKNVYQPFIEYSPLSGEIEFEKRYMTGENKQIKGILYDGLKLLLFYSDLLPPEEKISKLLNIIITDRLIGTFSEGDGRYHIHSILCSSLSLISTSGIVEGPAKPRAFYKLKHQSAAIGPNLPIELLKEQFRGQFIDYNDENLTEIIKGYVSQALFFNLTGNPFCDDNSCRLFNAHWQSELINTQLVHRKFCDSHRKILENLKEKVLLDTEINF